MQRIRKTLTLSHEFQTGPPKTFKIFVDFKSAVGAAGSSLSVRLGQWLMSDAIVCTKVIVINIDAVQE